MKRALIISRNLIGDALVAGIALREWFRTKRKEFDEFDLVTNNDHVTRLYHGLGESYRGWVIEWSNIFRHENECVVHGFVYDEIYNLGAGDAGAWATENKAHIAEGFANQLGVTLDAPVVNTPYGSFKAFKPKYNPEATFDGGDFEAKYRGYDWNNKILFSPYSASCSSRKGERPNKMLPWSHWNVLLNYLRGFGEIRMLGAPDDYAPPELMLDLDEVLTGVPLDELALIMRRCKLVITIDNGMGHLADSQDAKHVLFYPMCLGLNFIASWGAENTRLIQLDPADTSANQVLSATKRSMKDLGVMK